MVTPRTLERYAHAVSALTASLAFLDLSEITPEVVEKTCGEDKNLRSVLSMAMAEAAKARLITKNPAAVKRDQRSPQEGSLYYRANRKAWVAQVTLIEPGGKRVVKTKLVKAERKTKNPPEAAVRALEELKKLKSGGGLVKGTSTVEELTEEWLTTLRVKGPHQAEGITPATARQRRDSVHNQIIPFLGHVKLKDLTRHRVNAWLTQLETSTYVRNGVSVPYSANTIRLARNALRMALKWGVTEGILLTNVVQESHPPGGKPTPEKHAMSEDQARRLIEATRGTSLGTLWALMITTGLRRGEALGLRWSDFDGESITVTSQLKVEYGKVTRGSLKTTNSRRKIKLPDFLLDDLATHRERQKKGFKQKGKEPPELIFVTSTGKPVHPSNLRDQFINACKKAGIEPHEDGRPWSVHELRHTAASQLLNDRVPMQIVSKTLGHSSIAVTLDVYSHLTDQDSELVADSMSKRYGSKSQVKSE